MRAAILLSLFIIRFQSLAQTSDTATVQGQVIDESGAAVRNAEITAINQQTGFTHRTLSDETGRYTLSALPVGGQYRLEASHTGFAVSQSDAVTLISGSTARANFRLQIAAERKELTVFGESGSVRTDAPQLGLELRAREISRLPLLNRRITYLPLLNAANRPALNQGDIFMNQNLFTSNGSGRRQTWFEIDGASGSDSWGRQTIFTNIPEDAVEEISVLTNAFSAEYGVGGGSAVNVITRSGTRDFHGSLIGLWRPRETSAALSGFTSSNAANGNDITSDRLYQGAASLSGPLSPGRQTQFMAAVEYSAQDRASPVTSPVAPGSFLGRYRDWLGLLRVDHQFSDRQNVFLRLNGDVFYDTNPNGIVGGNTLPSVGRVFRRRTYTTEIGHTLTISPALVNNLRLQFQLGSPITQFDPLVYGTQYSVPISSGGTFVSGTSQSALLMNRQYQIADTAAATHGRHQLKFGSGLIYVHTGGDSKEFGGPIFLGQFTYKTCTLPLTVCESPTYLGDIHNVQSYTQSFGTGTYLVNDRLWSAFVQDDIRLRPDLTVNLGLRYELQTFADSTKTFAPRVGFAYDWGGRGVTVLRGGFGIYHSQILDNAQANYTLSGPSGVFNYTAGPGQVGFPFSVSSAPLPAFPPGAVLPVRSIYIRPSQLLRPYSEQWNFGTEHKLFAGWILSIDYLGSHSIRIYRPLDVNAPTPFVRTSPGQVRSAQAANCTRPSWVSWYAARGITCNPLAATNPQPPYSVIQTDVNNGYAYYHALNINLNRRFHNGIFATVSYSWSHAINNVDPDVPGQNPNDANFTGAVENASAIFDQRQRLVLSGVYTAPWRIEVGGIATLASALPYNVVTGINNSGDTGATTDRPVINGAVIGRNTGRGRPIYDFSPFVQRRFGFFGERIGIELRAEAFNVLNHANFVGYSGTYGNGAAPGTGFGQPLAGITNQLPARSFQFSVRLSN